MVLTRRSSVQRSRNVHQDSTGTEKARATSRRGGARRGGRGGGGGPAGGRLGGPDREVQAVHLGDLDAGVLRDWPVQAGRLPERPVHEDEAVRIELGPRPALPPDQAL